MVDTVRTYGFTRLPEWHIGMGRNICWHGDGYISLGWVAFVWGIPA